MKRRYLVLAGLSLACGLFLAGCGEPGATQVVKQLQTVQNKLTAYKSSAWMTVHMQGAVQRYYVETWYQAPNQYRIALGNENKEISQIILHNATGIYIINPGSKRLLKFQGDWAERQGHLYLYHALLSRIIAAQEPTFSRKEKQVSFTIPGDPLNPLIAYQRITLNGQTLNPVQVELLDAKRQPIVTLDYLSYQQNVQFPSGSFSPEQSTTLHAVEMPVAQVERGFGVVEPTWLPTTDSMLDASENHGVIFLRYAGKEPFTLAENRPLTESLSLGQGKLVTLFGIPAVLTGQGPTHQLYWMSHGVEFQLTSTMSAQDMVHIASSTLDNIGK
ncbi:outer membrane lipoprotein-sorting protein [Ferroacidibacillus organovorans]|uniref:DUF4367 domain-containing protein n=1 Tax=Ferroacidibacillus organovorans TaxID=1765683 RepID=A0A162TX59_9BACL|nr:outer membrane lipoprotein-sorting protein [Ferroacidibacillus organovorans]KYP81207.1 hypothetical protein AYJ22_08210 [Ferroacidibacillus organovorans]OAG93906.1 hypothetical protein AYW79_08180 [Ferroacidibacillus organovorans]OPG17708.1 hypothetical protein B2M26_00755 [Ferroacidibacillus organovorans]